MHWNSAEFGYTAPFYNELFYSYFDSGTQGLWYCFLKAEKLGCTDIVCPSLLS